MPVIVWIAEGTWPACVDAARARTAEDEDVTLLHVSEPVSAGVARGAFAGLLGRGRREDDPGDRVEGLGADSAARLLALAAERFGRPCTRRERSGRAEREVVAAAEDADLLVLARDGDRGHLGPRSLGPAARFVVDHAPCPVLLVWPEPAPDLASLPPEPPPHEPGPPPHEPAPPRQEPGPPPPPGTPPRPPGPPGPPPRPQEPPPHEPAAQPPPDAPPPPPDAPPRPPDAPSPPPEAPPRPPEPPPHTPR
ncbi:universal stress protein [Streptomyces tirandamycinicus]|uniref:universal stress protein n=1 Tax=Streptomyces tirandamycinicus TaxID=2174846 RepID=UPI002D1E4778|nr:universal stress protein [Streptomyces tirandamycinicus]